VAAPNLEGRERSERWGYTGAIILSGLGHAIFFALVLVILPSYFHQPSAPPPSYTVKIVDQLPAGDLGTHLPRLGPEHRAKARREEHKKPAVERPKAPLPAPENDKNVIALNTLGTPTPTPIAERTPRPTPEPTREPTPEPARAPTPHPTPKPRRHRQRPTPTPTPKRSERRREPERKIVTARAEPTPDVKARLAALKQQLLKEDLEHRKLSEAQKTNGPAGGGPVVANVPSEGSGYGVGAGTGSAGIQQDLQFLLYYRTVQERIKKAWSFAGGGSSDLTASVTFAIGTDGQLTGVKVTQSSRDPAFDDSVIRAIRRAAPFPPPPEKYRPQFAEGVEAVFKLGELKS
jgi:protein TonB